MAGISNIFRRDDQDLGEDFHFDGWQVMLNKNSQYTLNAEFHGASEHEIIIWNFDVNQRVAVISSQPQTPDKQAPRKFNTGNTTNYFLAAQYKAGAYWHALKCGGHDPDGDADSMRFDFHIGAEPVAILSLG
jgi:hypothetical protein